MRYPAEHKNKTRDDIVKKAAQEFRSKGLDGVGIAKLMSQLALTHGGFYRHFDDKEALLTEVSVQCCNEAAATLKACVESVPPGRELQAILDLYLSPAHRDNPSMGCVLPALGAELARQPRAVRSAFTKALKELFVQATQYMPGDSHKSRREQTIFLFSGMVGAVLMARTIVDPKLSDMVLETTRKSFLQIFTKEETSKRF